MATGENNDPKLSSLEEGQEEIWKDQGWAEIEVRPLPQSTIEALKLDLARLEAIKVQQDADWGWHQLELDEALRETTEP